MVVVRLHSAGDGAAVHCYPGRWRGQWSGAWPGLATGYNRKILRCDAGECHVSRVTAV